MGRESEAIMPNPADWCGGERNRRKLNALVILDYDKCMDTSYYRELEMSVDEITTWTGDQRYTMQFFYDLRVYGVGHAVASLENFAQDKGKLERVQNKLNKLRERIEEMYRRIVQLH
jgi:hypothetical protein